LANLRLRRLIAADDEKCKHNISGFTQSVNLARMHNRWSLFEKSPLEELQFNVI
jgi:hypothetical protein